MVSWGELRRWDAAAVGGVADGLNRQISTLVALNEEVAGAAKPHGWKGDAAIAANNRGTALITGLEQRVAEAAAVRRAAHEVQIALERLSSVVAETDELARRNSWLISDAGEVVLQPVVIDLTDPALAAERAKIHEELVDRVEQIVRRANDVDADLAAILTRAARGEITEQGAGTLAQAADAGTAQSGLTIIGPPPEGTPADNKAWWYSLSDTAKAAVFRNNPEWIGNLDGIPCVDRDAANRIILDREITRHQSVVDHNPGDEDAKGKLDGLRTIESRLNSPQPGQQQAFLLGLNTRDDGKAIVSAGNPDTAADVATYVPGTGSELASIGGDIDRSDRMVRAAQRAGSTSTAVITWLGYDAPDSILDAASESYADNGRGALAGFTDGLRATHEGPPSHNTVIGHSYGTTLIGHAASDGGLNTDDLVFVGSPGVGVDDVSQLKLDGVDQADIGKRVHSTVAEHDIIRLANIEVVPPGAGEFPGYGQEPIDIAHGPDPTDPDFGGQVFTSDPGTEGPVYLGGLSGAAHSEYWNLRSTSLTNMGRIIAGEPTS
ncbi:alpha/beta hydrolase [Saccharomonospora sp. NPDC046836]|uniref:alpha/beta hydrolase n=1 Tax=Saccharomonospora sp. NPDC046836 TaxID=3156921 RepID=UPI0033DCCA2B